MHRGQIAGCVLRTEYGVLRTENRNKYIHGLSLSNSFVYYNNDPDFALAKQGLASRLDTSDFFLGKDWDEVVLSSSPATPAAFNNPRQVRTHGTVSLNWKNPPRQTRQGPSSRWLPSQSASGCYRFIDLQVEIDQLVELDWLHWLDWIHSSCRFLARGRRPKGGPGRRRCLSSRGRSWWGRLRWWVVPHIILPIYQQSGLSVCVLYMCSVDCLTWYDSVSFGILIPFLFDSYLLVLLLSSFFFFCVFFILIFIDFDSTCIMWMDEMHTYARPLNSTFPDSIPKFCSIWMDPTPLAFIHYSFILHTPTAPFLPVFLHTLLMLSTALNWYACMFRFIFIR